MRGTLQSGENRCFKPTRVSHPKKKEKLRKIFPFSEKAKFAKVPHISPSPGGLQFLQFAKFRAEKNLFAAFFSKKDSKGKEEGKKKGLSSFFVSLTFSIPFHGAGGEKEILFANLL